jgi:hypothetical protein
MTRRAALERKFLALCRTRGLRWIGSVLRPLRLPGGSITVRDIPIKALRAAVQVLDH